MLSGGNGSKASIGDYDLMIRDLLERGQMRHPELFATGFFIGYFSLIIIPKRGATTEAENNNVYNSDIKLIN